MNLANAFAVLLLTHMAVAEDGQGQGRIRGGEERKTYIVTFNGGKPEETANGLAKLFGGDVKHVYTYVLNGAALNLPARAAAALAKNPAVERIEEDQEATAFASTSVPAESWGQSRIDQCLGGTNLPENFNRMDASSVRVYILDTGIYGGHDDFTTPTNRISPQDCHRSYYNTASTPPWLDGNGHGTHVASTVCGHKYGVVTCKELCAVKVLDNTGRGYWSDVIAGIDFVAANCAAAKATDPSLKCVANMSLGGGRSTSVDTAVNNAVQSGVTFTVAAGNSNADACNSSPAAAVSAITVGATTSSDTPASFTNWGSCVDVYGPGVSIKAAWIGSTTATNTISGTSMASPHVCGLAAAARETNQDPETYLKAGATKKTIDCRSPGTGISVIPDDTLNCSSTVSPACPTPAPTAKPTTKRPTPPPTRKPKNK
ncbi:hypothetical protein ACHAW5_009136 [Stephanodiscus triporus]|uniref:subtilisin n=1 Tax=Stephanodiscus triporus TaxID=2934178 RepID=A0ABD3QD04_9STRA